MNTEKQTGHTPLPWTFVTEPPYEECARIFSGTTYIACVGNSDHTKEETRANAEYIVRACNALPDLVAALENLIDACDGNYAELVDEARAALAKAQPEESK